MKLLFGIVAGLVSLLLVAVLSLAVYARLKPLPAPALVAHPGPDAPGVHGLEGGVKYVLAAADLPENGLARLLEVVRATPRTREIETESSSETDFTFVTRSRLFGFPDIARIWVEDGELHIYSHLVIGRSDLGVNAARVKAWVAQAFDRP